MRTENIFQIGKQVIGESFIGRKALVDDFRKHFLESNKHRTCSIVGLARSGKSSFLKNVFMQEYIPENYFYFYLDISVCSTYFSIWVSLCNSLNDYLELSVFDDKFIRTSNLLKEKIQEIISYETEPVLEGLLWNKVQQTIKTIFKLLKKIKIHSILVFDEFDHAQEIFKGTPQYALFRTIFSDADYDVSAITISRRKMETIENKIYQSSTLANVMDFFPFKGFDDYDMNEYFSIFSKKYNISLSQDDKELISYYAGNLPYLLSVIGYNIIESALNGDQIRITEIFNQKCSVINSYYQSCIDQLRVNNYLDKIIAFVIGPKINVDKKDAIELKSLGYLSVGNQSNYICISDYFSGMLSSRIIKTSVWNEIINLEKRLKSLVEHESFSIAKKYSIPSNNKKSMQRQILFTSDIPSCQIQTYDRFSMTNNQSYFDVMSLECTVRIIAFHWDFFFKKYFNNDNFTDYSHKLYKCASARNPVAHGHEDEVLKDADKVEVTAYCTYIFDILSKTFPQNTPI